MSKGEPELTTSGKIGPYILTSDTVI
jgi:hypothetical protein